jgi:hypothetical protein
LKLLKGIRFQGSGVARYPSTFASSLSLPLILASYSLSLPHMLHSLNLLPLPNLFFNFRVIEIEITSCSVKSTNTLTHYYIQAIYEMEHRTLVKKKIQKLLRESH